MAKDLHELTDIQLALMDEVWRRGEATVTEVHEALAAETRLAKKTIGTMMTRLEKQGFLTHRAQGREFVYEAAVSKTDVGSAKVRNVLDRIFGGSVPALVSHALSSDDVRPGDVERVRDLIDQWQKKEKKERKR